ncbi:MMPL family transporter [Magnetovibrio sp. PR-2]|uniref:MMPL family transporter n=1 Tax=Magnetovibrio sp. PR-2 TaxID=3120356 RepID=UPI002FCE367C
MRVENVLEFGHRHKLLSIIMVILCTVVAVSGLLKLKIDTSYESLISKEDSGWPIYSETVENFGSDNTTIIYVKDEALWTPDKLFMLEELVRGLEDLDKVEKVESLFSALSIRDDGGFLDASPLMDIAPYDQEETDMVKEKALYSPLIKRNLLSEQGNITAINVTVDRSEREPEFNLAFYEQVENLLVPVRENFGDVFQVGPPRLNVEIEKSMFEDLTILTPISSLLLFGSILFFLRTGYSCIIPMTTSGLSILWTFGFMGHMGIPLSLLTAIVPSLVIVIGSTEDTHMLTAYLHGIDNKKPDRIKAIRYMAKHVGLPIFITGFTTAIGFFSNALSEIPLIQHFAYASSFSMLANLLGTVLMVPLMLAVAGPRKNPLGEEDGEPTGLVGQILKVLDNIGDKHGPKVVITTAILLVALGWTATTVRVSNDPLSYFKSSNPLVHNADTLHDGLSGMQIFYLTFNSQKDQFFREPENLKAIESIADALRDQENTVTGGEQAFDKVISLSDYVALLNREMKEADAAHYRVPDTRREIDELLLMLQRSDVERFSTFDYSKLNIVVRHNISDSHVLNTVLDEFEEKLKPLLPENVTYQFTGENLMINRAAESLFSSQIESLAILIVLILFIMTTLYTSIVAGVISLVPNLIPVVFNFGVMGLFEIPLNPGTATVAAIAVGIAIDDTIHLMTRYAEICRQETDQKKAAKLTVRSQAVPVVSTSISLALGFGILAISNFQIVAQFGFLAAATMMYALLSDLLVTPIILRSVRIVGMYDIVSMKVSKTILDSCPLFDNMSPYQIKKSILLSQIHSFEEQDALLQQGDVDRKLLVVLEGSVEVVRTSGGSEIRLAEMGPGSVIGEIAFVRKGIERTATVRALEPVTVMSMEWESTQKGLKFYPRIASMLNSNISRILGERLAKTTEDLAEVRKSIGST